MKKIVALGNAKGDVGKTSLAVNLEIAHAIVGRDVWLIDGDGLGTVLADVRIQAAADR